MSNKIDNFSVLFVKRNAAKRGPTSSEAWNDTIEELSHDLTELSSQWNDRLVPLLSTIPNGSEGNISSAVDAWSNGLDGSTVFVDATASLTLNANYFNSSANRPNTILEQLDDLYSEIVTLQDDIATQIAATTPTAEQISIADNGGLYLASNVETALAEVIAKTNTALALDPNNVNEVAPLKTPTGTTETLDFSLGTFQILDLESASGDVTVTLSNSVPGHTYKIKVIQDSTTPRNIIWPGTVKWPSGSPPTITVGANAEDLITLTWDGTSYYGSFDSNFT